MIWNYHGSQGIIREFHIMSWLGTRNHKKSILYLKQTRQNANLCRKTVIYDTKQQFVMQNSFLCHKTFTCFTKQSIMLQNSLMENMHFKQSKCCPYKKGTECKTKEWFLLWICVLKEINLYHITVICAAN